MTPPASHEGLITQFGHWLDRQFKAKATQESLIYYFNLQENASIKDKLELQESIQHAKSVLRDEMEQLKTATANLKQAHNDLVRFSEALEKKLAVIPPEGVTQALSKDLDDLKTRMERMGLYSGMTRKVDPTKAAVVKSAFSM